MRLGERESIIRAQVLRSQCFDSGEVTELYALPKACPLRSGRITDFSLSMIWPPTGRGFSDSKQDANDAKAWAALAGNPLWNNALRMLGQHLLRQPNGTRTQWDVAFEEAEQLNDTMPLAADILLDALFLDPNADNVLERARRHAVCE